MTLASIDYNPMTLPGVLNELGHAVVPFDANSPELPKVRYNFHINRATESSPSTFGVTRTAKFKFHADPNNLKEYDVLSSQSTLSRSFDDNAFTGTLKIENETQKARDNTLHDVPL